MFLKIACTLLNDDFVPIFKDKPEHEAQADRILERLDMSNQLQQTIEARGLATTIRNRMWNKLTANLILDFPRVTPEELKRQITGGPYQVHKSNINLYYTSLANVFAD